MSYVKGIYKKDIFKSERGYIIGLLKLEETDNEVMSDYIGKTITFTGYFPELDEGDSYIFNGSEKEHPRYGLQFEVTSYEKQKPNDKDGVVAFLSSDLFPGIGKKLAQSIVDTLGETALDHILEDPSCLQLVPKITSKKAMQNKRIGVRLFKAFLLCVLVIGVAAVIGVGVFGTALAITAERAQNEVLCWARDEKIVEDG